MNEVLGIAARFAEGQQVSQQEFAILNKAAQQHPLIYKLVLAREQSEGIPWTYWVEANHSHLV